MSITPIRPDVVRPDEADPEIIRILEAALEHAKEGHLVGIALTLLSNSDSDSAYLWSYAQKRYARSLLGTVLELQHDILNQFADHPTDS